jgi:competence protein ComEA
MERNHSASDSPRGDLAPGVVSSAARSRLAALHGPAQTPSSAPGRLLPEDDDALPAGGDGSAWDRSADLAWTGSGSAGGGIPLSEAIAAQYYARRSWWRKLAEALGERTPSTLRGRWALDFRAAVALACLALFGAVVGGWYLWRSQATVVELPAASGASMTSTAVVAELSQDSATAARSVAAMPTAVSARADLGLGVAAQGGSEPGVAGPGVYGPAPVAAAVAGPASGMTLVVDVEGKVTHPGVQTLPPGSRVYEALRAAGGVLPGADATGLDLARPLVDGEQLRIGLPGAPSPPAGLEPTPTVGGPHGKRGKSGPPVSLNTATLEQLQGIPGVGPAMAQRILDWRTQYGRFTGIGQLRQVRGIGDRKFADMKDSVTL